jgi:hypothetical protein
MDEIAMIALATAVYEASPFEVFDQLPHLPHFPRHI